MGVTPTNRSDLAKARALMRQMSSGAWVGDLAKIVCAGEMKFVADEFNQGVDPYGKPWTPLARERTRDRLARLKAQKKGQETRGMKILVNSARMRNSTGVAVVRTGQTSAAAKITIPTWYAKVHQNGATINPHSRLARPGEHFLRRNPNGKRGYQVVKSHRKTYASGFKIPQRRILPDKDVVPIKWAEMVRTETRAFMLRRFGR